MTVELIVICSSLLLQVLSALLAVRLIIISKKHAVGILILAATGLMAFRRGISLYRTISGEEIKTDLFAEVVALLISTLFLIGIIYIARLIITAKKTSDSLQKSRDHWENTFDTITDIITIHDTDYNIVRANKAAREQFRLPEGDGIKVKCYEAYHGTTFRPEYCPAERCLQIKHAVHTENFEPYFNKYMAVSVIPYYNVNNELIGMIHVARDITGMKQAEKEKEDLIGKLQDAAGTIRTLQGILPICASCKKIRDDNGYWRQIETYIREHSDADFSHSICPECANKIYPGFYLGGKQGL